MILSSLDKEAFNKSMDYFNNLLNIEIESICKNLKLVQLSFGIPLESQEDILYFDYPYHMKVDEINESLLPNGKYSDVDVKMYSLLELTEMEIKYIAYSYDDNEFPIKISGSYETSLSIETISCNGETINNFFLIMYYSSFPKSIIDKKFADIEVKIGAIKEPKKWFIVIHNEDIQDPTNTVISNYCLVFKGDIKVFIKDKLDAVATKLKNFSKFYGSKAFNVILRKNVEYSDTILSLNSEIYHHIKELNLNLSLIPIQNLKENYPGDKRILIVERNLERIQNFYESYVMFLKSKNSSVKVSFDLKEYFKSDEYISFVNDLCSTNENLVIETNIEGSANFIALPQYLDIIFKELILNAANAIAKQAIQIKKISIYTKSSDDVLSVSILSMETSYTKQFQMPMNYLGVKLLQSNSKSGECGYGLYLTNKLLKNLNAKSFETEKGLRYFNISEDYYGIKGFTVNFILPVNQ